MRRTREHSHTYLFEQEDRFSHHTILMRSTGENSPTYLVSRKGRFTSPIILVRRKDKREPTHILVSRKTDSLIHNLGEKDEIELTHIVGEQEDRFTYPQSW